MTATLYTVSGTGAAWDQGYPADLARALTEWDAVWFQLKGQEPAWDWQGVSYGPNGIPAAFPMQPSIDSGVEEMARLMRLRDPSKPWGFIGYSQGAIVTADILDRCGITRSSKNTDLAAYAKSFIGGVTFGNPRREAGHTLPGGIDPGGHGIVTPNLVGTPASVWDMAAGSKMAGSPGNDLYATCGVGLNAHAVADEEAVWKIVDSVSITGQDGVLAQLFKVLSDPVSGGIGAVESVLNALDFFVVQGLTPHTSYQFTQPIPGDPRDCWRIALDYLYSLGQETLHPTPKAAAEVVPVPAPAKARFSVQSVVGVLQKLPTIRKELVAGLTTGAAMAGVLETLLPHAQTGPVAAIATASAGITTLLSLLTNNKVVEVVDDVAAMVDEIEQKT